MGKIRWSKYESNTWSPEKAGDAITGEIFSIEERDGRSGKTVPVLGLATSNGERTVWGGGVDLQRKLAATEPDVGDTITITLVGFKDTGAPQPMKEYDVEVERNTGSKTGDEKPF
jgi:hypothetical protein